MSLLTVCGRRMKPIFTLMDLLIGKISVIRHKKNLHATPTPVTQQQSYRVVLCHRMAG